jgi:hypothetical protein
MPVDFVHQPSLRRVGRTGDVKIIVEIAMAITILIGTISARLDFVTSPDMVRISRAVFFEDN